MNKTEFILCMIVGCFIGGSVGLLFVWLFFKFLVILQ